MQLILRLVALCLCLWHSTTAMGTVASTTRTTMNGVWTLDENRSESLAPILAASGAPRFVSGLLARYLDKDMLHFHRNDTEVSVQYKRKNVGLTIKLPSGFSFRVGQVVSVTTPNGDQSCHVVDIADERSCKMIRHGPRKGEKTDDIFEMDEDGESMIYRMLHTSRQGAETEVRRVFKKVVGE